MQRTKKVVQNVMADLSGRHHIVFVDQFYTSVDLAYSLLARGKYINNSFKTSRVEWPAELKPNKRLQTERILFDQCIEESQKQDSAVMEG